MFPYFSKCRCSGTFDILPPRISPNTTDPTIRIHSTRLVDLFLKSFTINSDTIVAAFLQLIEISLTGIDELRQTLIHEHCPRLQMNGPEKNSEQKHANIKRHQVP